MAIVFGVALNYTTAQPKAASTTPERSEATAVTSVTAEIDAARYPTLQDALKALPSTGGIVRLAAKKYEISEPLRLPIGNVKIVGAGTSTQIVNSNRTDQPAFHVGSPDFAKKKTRIYRVEFADLRFTGTKESGDGILAEGVNDIYLHGVTSDHHGGHGVNLVDCYEDPRIVGCMLTYNGKSGLQIEACHDIVVSATHFEENLDAVQCLNSFNLCMTGNNVDDHLRNGVVIENTYGSIVSSNMIEECKGTALIMDRDCYGITVSANVIAHHMGGGIKLLDAWGCAIARKHLYDRTRLLRLHWTKEWPFDDHR